MKRTYIEAAHAVQTGVALEIERKGVSDSSASPKHLRTGLDMRAADMKGLAELLIQKGVFTQAEYLEAVTKAANDEADEWTQRASAILGHPVTLA